jgi:hypothetical protein
MKNDDIENKTKSKIYHLAFGYGIKAQIVKIRRKFFSTKRMALISSLILLIAGSTVFFSANYFAKGATYGWLQSTWSGGASTTAIADHTTPTINPTGPSIFPKMTMWTSQMMN